MRQSGNAQDLRESHSKLGAAGGGVGGGGHALLPPAAVPGQLGRQQARQEEQGEACTVLYCAVLYCTVLCRTVMYCTASPAQGDRSTKQLEIEVQDKQEIGDFSASYFKGRKNLMSNIFLDIEIFS